MSEPDRGPADHPPPTGQPYAVAPPDGPPAEAALAAEQAVEVAELETHWRRLDRRMLLIHPIQEAIRFLPALVGIFILGRTQSGDGHWWELIGLVIVVGVGVMRYFTTRFRIQNGQIELRKGLLNRQVIATPEDRVRTVDVTAPPFHRILGLAKVEIGTAGQQHERLVLDALPLADAKAMREELIHLRTVVAAREAARVAARAAAGMPVGAGFEPPAATSTTAPAPAWAPTTGIPADATTDETTLLALDPAWVRYAPLTMSGLVSALAIFGFANQLIRAAIEGAYVRNAVQALGAHAWWAELLVGLAGVAVVVSVLAVIGYVLQYWHFRLTRHRGGTIHVSRGLLTTRETSIEEKRLRGVEVGEPLGLRLAGGGRLKAITTGLSRREDERGSAWLVPPAPADVVASVAEAVVSDHDALTAELTPHGPAARRRRYLRAVVPALVLAVAGSATVWRFDWAPWLLVLPGLLLAGSPFLARDRYAGLGHHLAPDHLVVRSGSFSRRRDVLQRSGIIGWTVRSTWFQRRVGLAHLVATTAAGKQSYTAYDLPVDQAVALAHEVDPGLISQFVASV